MLRKEIGTDPEYSDYSWSVQGKWGGLKFASKWGEGQGNQPF